MVIKRKGNKDVSPAKNKHERVDGRTQPGIVLIILSMLTQAVFSYMCVLAEMMRSLMGMWCEQTH